MNIDERLQALTISLELQSHEREKDNEKIRELIVLAGEDGEHIPALVRIAEIHDRRLNHLEDHIQ